MQKGMRQASTYISGITSLVLLLLAVLLAFSSAQAQDSDNNASGLRLEGTSTITPTPDPVALAETGVTENAQWMPFVQEFDEIEMVLVPAGCFQMGSTDKQIEAFVDEMPWRSPKDFLDEQPAHEICFEEPFWIDRHEVTQGDFVRLGGTQENGEATGDRRPVEEITWFEARDFCELRGGRLPTEAEWEYVARGPDALIYPWGNEWDPAVVNYGFEGFGEGPVDVASFPDGASWVGTFDMAGNVWEWTSSLYTEYPYDENDGREASTGTRTDVFRVLRGGPWFGGQTYFITSDRDASHPHYWMSDYGFRCVLDYTS